MLKTHTCGELNLAHEGQQVTLAGWVNRRRDHGGLVFIDARDRAGLAQVVFNRELAAEAHHVARELRNEYVIQVTGTVRRRPAGTENPRLPSGDIEVSATQLEILNPAETPPFYINEEVEVDEGLRLKYRYLDLRRPAMQQRMIMRHKAVKYIRDFMDAEGFLEIETPILFKSSPEGARDYLVPSRVHPGKFYALPQSPQQLKQLLMVAGYEKYFQIARCFRDEDQRADRQPEFTQLDVEMSWIDEDDIMALAERLYTGLIRQLRPDARLDSPFPRLTYQEAMQKYGSDKPDLRFGLEIANVTDVLAATEFEVAKGAIRDGGIVRGLAAPGCGGYTRRQIDDLGELAKGYGARGLITMALGAPGEAPASLDALTMEHVRSNVARFFSIEQVQELARRTGAKPGDLLLMVAGAEPLVAGVLGSLRSALGERLGLADPNYFALAFVVDFPMFERNEGEDRWEPMHHMFTSPMPADLHLLETDPGKVRARAYDLVCNGYELGGGSIRIHRRELQQQVMRLINLSPEVQQERFGHMLEAFTYGAPPHGGIATGIDRVAMLLAGAQNIREVIAFPKNQSAQDVMTDAPSEVEPKQLGELHVQVAPTPSAHG